MPDRYGRRDEPYRGERGWREERGFTDRARDQMRSWFGDEEAERRRRADEREREFREPPAGRGDTTAFGGEYDRSGAAYRGWNEPDYGYRPARGYGYGGSSGSPSRSFDRPNASRDSQYLYEWSGWPHTTGTYAGRGPKGYQRSDERIREDVCDRLADDPHVDASDVDVAVKNGEVTLSGAVIDRSHKRRSEDVVERVSGVRDVHNNLRVNRSKESGAVGTSATGASAAAPTTRR
jgi:osmotically-inducible protein OsmY